MAERLGVTGRFDDIFDIHALDYIYPKPKREAYRALRQRACGVAPGHAAMFDDLPHNLETAHALGMTTVLVHGVTEHPEHQAMAGWTELPSISITAPTRSRRSSPQSARAASERRRQQAPASAILPALTDPP